jgi:hypothetical protein
MINFRKPMIVSVVILAAATLYISDQYVYSWVGFLSGKMGNCDFKQVTTSTAKDGEYKKLNYPVDLARTAERLRTDQNYEVTGNENNLTISRNFADLKYSILFENRENQDTSGVYYKYSIDCANCEISSLPGEKCTTADFQLYKKIYHIIEDLSLDHRAAYELQSGLKIVRQNF